MAETWSPWAPGTRTVTGARTQPRNGGTLARGSTGVTETPRAPVREGSGWWREAWRWGAPAEREQTEAQGTRAGAAGRSGGVCSPRHASTGRLLRAGPSCRSRAPRESGRRVPGLSAAAGRPQPRGPGLHRGGGEPTAVTCATCHVQVVRGEPGWGGGPSGRNGEGRPLRRSPPAPQAAAGRRGRREAHSRPAGRGNGPAPPGRQSGGF